MICIGEPYCYAQRKTSFSVSPKDQKLVFWKKSHPVSLGKWIKLRLYANKSDYSYIPLSILCEKVSYLS